MSVMKPRAIVIDDDEGCRNLITLILKQRGYEVVSLSDPTVCPLYDDLLAVCPHEDACGDFLLTDQRMPKMTGLEFVETQGRRGCKGVVNKKAVLSASWTPEELEKAEELGCKVFRKPYDVKAIADWLDEQEKSIAPGRKLARLEDL